MVGWPVELSARLPIARKASGRPRNMAQNRKNGPRPSQDQERARGAGRAGGAPCSVTTVAVSLTIGSLRRPLLDVGPDHGIPLGRDERLRLRCLIRVRIDGAGDIRELRDQVAGHATRLEVVKPGGVAVALQPAGLALVGV